jgi:hypothetical protein
MVNAYYVLAVAALLAGLVVVACAVYWTDSVDTVITGFGFDFKLKAKKIQRLPKRQRPRAPNTERLYAKGSSGSALGKDSSPTA